MEWLINWLWQGLALTAIAALALSILRRLNAATRHRVWWVTLWLVLLLPLLASVASEPPSSAPRPLGVSGADAPSEREARPLLASAGREPATPPLVLGGAPSWVLEMAVGIWMAWMLTSGARAARSLRALRQFRRRSRPIPLERERNLPLWQSQRSTGRSATLRISYDVATAGVFGFSPPMIALSPTALAALSDADLDRVVAHEHAHVQRRDDIGRVLHAVIHAVFGLHPAVWWIGRAIDLEREIACDDWVLALTGDGPRYARCLTTLAGVSPKSGWSLAPGVSLATRRLTARVTRLLDRGRRGGTRISPTAVVVSCPTLVALAVSLAAVKLVVVQEAEAIAVKAATVVERGAAAVVHEPVVTTVASTVGRKLGLRRSTVVPAAAPAADQSRSPSELQVRPSAPPVAPIPDANAAAPLINLRTAASVAPLNAQAAAVSGSLPSQSTPQAPDADGPRPPWTHAANAGVAIGTGSKHAAVKTAGFFSRLGKSVAGSF